MYVRDPSTQVEKQQIIFLVVEGAALSFIAAWYVRAYARVSTCGLDGWNVWVGRSRACTRWDNYWPYVIGVVTSVDVRIHSLCCVAVLRTLCYM
jgi:hypothetical protein